MKIPLAIMNTTCQNSRPLLITLFVIPILALASAAHGDTFRFNGGIPDNFALPTESPSPSLGLQTLFSSAGPPFRQYDQGGDDKHFLETFTDLPLCMDSGQVFTTIKPTGPVDIANFARGTTDIIQFLFVDNSGSQVGPFWASFFGNPTADASLLTQNWGTDNFSFGLGLLLSLDNLPLGTNNTNGSTGNLLLAMEQFGHLDIRIQDDTIVDFLSLVITTGLIGDIDGDGTVDNDDLTLAVALDGLTPPNGVGDTNGDNVINIADQFNIITHLGDSCVIPEPSSCVLALLGCLGVALSARRRTTPQQPSGSRCLTQIPLACTG